MSVDYMLEALDLARSALGRTSPNPAVGAVVVRDGQIVGRGRTQPAGSWHAEVMALHEAAQQARGASLYVTLEPCSHHGRTPPCTQSIIAAGVAEVHCAVPDPNPLVNGRGQRELESAGIATAMGERRAEALEVVEAFAKHITTRLPFVVAKYAMTLDGKIATSTGDSKWITSAESRQIVHCLRDEVDAIMVGVGTVLADDPQLTVRHSKRDYPRPVAPLRVVVDSQGRLPLGAQLLNGAAPTLVATTERMPLEHRNQLGAKGAEILVLPAGPGGVDLRGLLLALGHRGIVSVLAEGGAALLGSLFDLGLVDKIWAFIAPRIIGGREAPSPIEGMGSLSMAQAARLERLAWRRIGEDTLIIGYVARGESCSRG